MTATEIQQLLSNQEETDTRVVLYLQYAASIKFPAAIVRTPDSDIFFILLHHALNISMTIYMDVGVGKNRRLINVKPHLHGRLLAARIDILPFFFLKSRRSLTRRKIHV